MDTRESNALTQFCIDQYYEFDADAWLRQGADERNASALAAMYLSMTSWYGHEEQLERIAARARAVYSTGEEFQRAAQSNGFDLAHFSAAVRYGIAMRRMASSAGEANPAERNASP